MSQTKQQSSFQKETTFKISNLKSLKPLQARRKSDYGFKRISTLPVVDLDQNSRNNSNSPLLNLGGFTTQSKKRLMKGKQNQSHDSGQEVLIDTAFDNKDTFAKAYQILRSGQGSQTRNVRPKSQNKKQHSAFVVNSRRVTDQKGPQNQVAQNLIQESFYQGTQKYRTQSQVIDIHNKDLQKESKITQQGLRLDLSPGGGSSKHQKNQDIKNIELQEMSMFNGSINHSPKNLQADDCYKVLQKLQRISNNLVGKGQTIALKHFKNQGEANRFGKTLQELNQLKDKLLMAESDQDQFTNALKFISRVKSDKFRLEYYMKKIPLFIHTILEIDFTKLDPQYSLSDIIKRILRQQEIFQDPNEVHKQFEILKQQQLQNRIKYQEIEDRKKHKNTEERIQNYCSNQTFYDVSDLFWATKNPAILANRYQSSTIKFQDKEHLNLSKLESFIEENKNIQSPEIPKPSITKQFPFASQMGRPRTKLTYQRKNHSTIDEPTDKNAYTSQKKRELKQHLFLRNGGNYKTNQPSLTQNKIMKELNKSTIVTLEQDSLLQRNKILLERVIYDRKKYEEAAIQNLNIQGTIKQKKPPSSLNRKENAETDTTMVFIKDEGILYQN